MFFNRLNGKYEVKGCLLLNFSLLQNRPAFFAYIIVLVLSPVYSQAKIKEMPGEPPNAAADLIIGSDNMSLELYYDSRLIAQCSLSDQATVTSTSSGSDIIEQKLLFACDSPLTLKATIFAGCEALAAC